MNKTKMFDAMAKIDENLIDRSIKTKNDDLNRSNGKTHNRTLKKAILIAAAAVLIIALASTAVTIAVDIGETKELAKTAVDKLQQSLVFMPGVSSILTHTLNDEYENTAKWVAPELVTLETKNNGAAALIELYENLIKEYRACDLDAYYDTQVKACAQPGKIEFDDEFIRIREIQNSRMVIEALLALDCYYDQLKEKDVSRMLGDFDEFAAIDYASSSKYYDDASEKTMFDMYRSGGYGGVMVITD